jgi:hypothetical protein
MGFLKDQTRFWLQTVIAFLLNFGFVIALDGGTAIALHLYSLLA